MPEREAKQRLDEWRTAERAEAGTEPGSTDSRRAGKETRRGRWAYQDAARLAAEDQGSASESLRDRNTRMLDRAAQLGGESAAMHPRANKPPESMGDREDRERDEEEFEREIGPTPGKAQPERRGDLAGMKLYFAGPLFSAAERDWNAALTAALRAAGHEVFLPQENEPGKTAPQIFAVDVGGIDWADGLVAIMDGPDPDSGTCWEVGYAYGCGKPIVLVRTDFRTLEGSGGAGYNPMLTEAATIRIDLPAASMAEVSTAVLDALRRLELPERHAAQP